MANPKIVYDPGTGPIALNFQFAPRRVPAYLWQAVRHDNVSSAGVRESITERVDQFLTLEMEWVLAGADIGAWGTFMRYAMAGGPFSYFPDASVSAFTNYCLEDKEFQAEYKAPGQYTFKVKMRQAVS